MRLHRLHQSAASLRDLREDVVLVLRVSLYRIHEIWNQIRASLQLHLDLTLRSVGLLIQLLNAIVSATNAREEQGNCEPLSSHRAPHDWRLCHVNILALRDLRLLNVRR
jgi:hypothetical protein